MSRWLLALTVSLLLAPLLPAQRVAAAPAGQQLASDYVCQARAWQNRVVDVVAFVDGQITATTLDLPAPPRLLDWESAEQRARLALSVDEVAAQAPRPAPGNEAYFRLLVEPVSAALEALSAAIGVGRREDARAALDELYGYVPRREALGPPGVPSVLSGAPPCDAGVTAVSARPAPAIEVAPTNVDNLLVQAYRLGWRWYRDAAPETYLRDFWAAELERLGQPMPPGADWERLRAQAQGTLAALGPENVRSAAANYGQRAPATSLADPAYAPFVRDLRVLRYECDVFRATVNLTDEIDRFLRLMRLGLFTDPAWRGAVNRVARDWQARFTRISAWTPPTPQYTAQQAELLDLLATLNLAAENVALAQRASGFTVRPGDPRNAQQLNEFYYREAANLVRDIRERVEVLPEPTIRRGCVIFGGDEE